MFEAIDNITRTELASRKTNSITVRLLWTPTTNLLTVTVDDTGNGDYFELILNKHDRPLHVFHHPFAHAAARGIDFRTSPPELLLDAA